MSRLVCKQGNLFRNSLGNKCNSTLHGSKFHSSCFECTETESRSRASLKFQHSYGSLGKRREWQPSHSSCTYASVLHSQQTLLRASTHFSSHLKRNLMQQSTQNWQDLSPGEKAEKYQRPKAQTTIDEEEVSKFSGLSALWWDEGGEFEALHSLNELRVPLIRNGLVSLKTLDKYDMTKPLDGFWILDVGSGGGILSEPLARLGASVVGLEASEENIKIAQAHLIHDPHIRERIKYIHATVEDIAEEQAGKFDAVVASEVLEHVADADTFVSSACQLVKPGGSIFFTTLNKTAISYALGIVVAERVLRLVSPGTHDWQKFISPRDLQFLLDKNNFSTRLVHGVWYNPFTKRWSWTKDTSINYAIHAVRASDADSPPEETEWQQAKPQSGSDV